MRQFLSALCLAVVIFGSAPAWASDPVSTVFPPDNEANCTDAGQKFLSWFNGAGATHCSSGQEVLDNALPNCGEGQQVVRENGKFVCKSAGPMQGMVAGYCAQSWGGVEQIGTAVEPAYFDTTSAGRVSGYNTTKGCLCRAGWTMHYTGTCAEGNCLIPATGGTNVMYPAGVFYSACTKD